MIVMECMREPDIKKEKIGYWDEIGGELKYVNRHLSKGEYSYVGKIWMLSV